MIIEWLLEISAGFLEWIGSLFPPIDLPEWVESPFLGLQWIIEAAAGWGVWINVPFVAGVAALCMSAFVITFTIKLVRVLIAHVPFFGGRG